MLNINCLLKSHGFIRETEDDLLQLIKDNNLQISDVIPKIIQSQTPTTDLFSMSVYLYGYKPVKRKLQYDFYFFCEKLYEQPIKHPTSGESFTFTYIYDPIIGDAHKPENPCHFIFRVRDSKGIYLPREASTKTLQKYNKVLAKHIITEFLCETVCLEPQNLLKWDIANNSNLLKFK